MLWNVALTVRLASLDDHLGVVNNVHASNEQSKQEVAQAVDAAAVARDPAHQSVHQHARHKRRDQAAKEEVASALAVDGNAAEGGEHDASDGHGVHDDGWVEFDDVVHGWADEEADAEGHGPHVAHSLVFGHVWTADLVTKVAHAHHDSDRHEEAVEHGVRVEPHGGGTDEGTDHDVAVHLGQVLLRFVRNIGDLKHGAESVNADVIIEDAVHIFSLFSKLNYKIK